MFPVSPSSSLPPTSKTNSPSISQELKEKRMDSLSGIMTDIPHHFTAAAGQVKKAARVLAATVFTVKERCTCTVSGFTKKDIEAGETNLKPKFDERRMALIHGKYIFNWLVLPHLIMRKCNHSSSLLGSTPIFLFDVVKHLSLYVHVSHFRIFENNVSKDLSTT